MRDPTARASRFFLLASRLRLGPTCRDAFFHPFGHRIPMGRRFHGGQRWVDPTRRRVLQPQAGRLGPDAKKGPWFPSPHATPALELFGICKWGPTGQGKGSIAAWEETNFDLVYFHLAPFN